MSTRLYSILTTAVLLLAILLPPLARAQNASQQLAAASVLETIKKRGAIRVGLAPYTNDEDVDRLLTGLGEIVLSERKKSQQLLEARLQRGIKEGDLPRGTNVKSLARFYVTVQQGMSIQARDGASARELDRVVTTAMQAWPGA